jgi:drug/metabolite transporter (DMT)-like permease
VWAQQHASASHTAILFSLEPVFAAITSFVFLHERLGARALAGAGLILAGILLVELRGSGEPAAPESLAERGNF